MKPLSKTLYLRKTLSAPRFLHSLGTAEMTARLCRIHGYPAKRGREAALLHDIARELPDSEIVRLSLLDGFPVEDWEREHPILLHGRAGVQLAETIFGVLDEEIREAIICHTTGRPAMGILAKIIFIADYIAPDREHVTDAYRGELFRFSLDRQVLTVLRDLIAYLEGRGMFIAPPSAALRRELERIVIDG